MKRWYVAYTAQFKEAVAERHLRMQGFETYCPKLEKTVRHARQLRQVRRPYFPRYVFTSFDIDQDQWRRINGTQGVVSLIQPNNRPASLPAEFVEQLRSITGLDGVLRDPTGLKVGDSVRMTAGAFVDHVGQLVTLDEAGRIQVLLEMMGAFVPVSSDLRSVTAA